MKNYSPKLQHKKDDFLMKSKNSVANDEASGCTKSECDQHTEQAKNKIFPKKAAKRRQKQVLRFEVQFVSVKFQMH